MKNGLIIDSNGNKYWYENDLLHCEDGPAIETVQGNKYWYKYGKQHREDGPAVEFSNNMWFFNGEKIECKSQEEFKKFLKLRAFI